MYRKKILFLVLSGAIIFIFLFTRFYDLENRYSFDHDQEAAADAAWKFIVDKKPMLIGQETSVGGLFVGPFLWWFQAIAMALGKMNPISLAYLGSLVSLITLILIFFTVKDISNKWQGLIAGYLYTISPRLLSYDMSSSAISYIMLFSILIYYLLVKIIGNRKYYLLPILAFTLSATFHIHFTLILLLPAVLIIFILKRPKIHIKYFISSAIAFLMPLVTFLIFDLRHGFLIANKLKIFSSQKSFSLHKLFNTTLIYVDVLMDSISINTKLNIFILLMIILGFIYLVRNKKNILIFSLILLLIPLIALWFYSGHISEYYFLPIVPIFLIITSFLGFYIFQKNAAFFLLLVLVIGLFNFTKLKNSFINHLPLSYKEEVINMIIADSNNNDFNVYYQMPSGIDKGYRYIFKWKKRIPKDGSNLLYILEYNSPDKFEPVNYYKTFIAKDIKIQSIGPLYLIAVKL